MEIQKMLKKNEIVEKLKMYNLKKVARETGLSYETVRNVAKGKSMSLKTYEKLASLLGII